MTQHTPGPWHLQPGPYENGLARKVTVNGRYNTEYVMSYGDRKDANARLIAAAPELLERLQDAVSLLENYEAEWDDDSTATGILANIRAAIAKATGSP